MSIELKPGEKIGQTTKRFRVGDLEPLEESCVYRAEETFRARSKKDTNPAIVQMILNGKPINHWYYRSDQWIDQPFLALGKFQPYVGPANRAQRFMYGEGKYVVDQRAIDDCIKTEDLDIEEEESL